jgi:hypothetical protein
MTILARWADAMDFLMDGPKTSTELAELLGTRSDYTLNWLKLLEAREVVKKAGKRRSPRGGNAATIYELNWQRHAS